MLYAEQLVTLVQGHFSLWAVTLRVLQGHYTPLITFWPLGCKFRPLKTTLEKHLTSVILLFFP